MKDTILKLEGTQKLHSEGFSLPVLAEMERRALLEAHKSLSLVSPGTSISKDALLKTANEVLPKGASLYRAYVQTKADERKFPVQDLENLAHSLEHAASRLEALVVKSKAKEVAGHLNFQDVASIQGQLAARYAGLIRDARKLEESGVIPLSPEGSSKLSTKTEGPLSSLYEKAISILDSQTSEPMRMRMSA